MNTQQILALEATKTEKIKRLLAAGHSRKEVAQLLGVGYGFVQNVYAKTYGVARRNNRSAMPFRFDRSFGVEIEATGSTPGCVAQAIRQAGVPCHAEGYNHARREHWKVVTDASVPGGFEVVSPVLKGKSGLKQLHKVCAALKGLGARIDRRCGLHIHLGTGDFGEDPQVWKALYGNYAALEGTIDSFMPASRRGQTNHFCRSLRVNQLERKLAAARTLREIEDSVTRRCRYFKLNSQSFWRHKTIEFRQHSGTIDYEKIANWIEFCARFVEFSRRGHCAEGSFEGLKKFLSTKGLAFYKNRSLQLAA